MGVFGYIYVVTKTIYAVQLLKNFGLAIGLHVLITPTHNSPGIQNEVAEPCGLG